MATIIWLRESKEVVLDKKLEKLKKKSTQQRFAYYIFLC
jgi:hypothetical protein